MGGVYKRDIVAILQVLKRVEALQGSAVGDSAMLTNVPTFIQQMDMWKIMRTKGAQNMLAEFANWTYETLIAKNENVPQLLDGTEDAETRNKKIGPNLAPFDAIESGLTIISNRNEKDRMEDLAKIPEGELTQEKLDELNKRYPTRLMDILENLIVQMKDMKEGGQAHQDLILLAEMANATWKARQTSERRERDVFRPWSLLSKEQIDKDFIFLDQFLPKVLEMLKQMRSEAYSPEVRKQFQQQINVMVDKAAEVMRKNGESFDARSLDAIRKTALGVMEMFSEKTRKDGVTPYFTHQLGMAMLALDTFKFNDTVGSLIALLHHDTREDLPDMYDAYKNYIRGKIILESDAVARDKRIAQVDSFLLEVKLLSKLDGDSDDVELIKKYFQQMEDPTNPAFNFAPREGQDWYTADFIHDIQAIKLIDILFNIGDLFNVFKDANLEAMSERTKGLPERSYKKLFIGIENLVIPSKFLSKEEKLQFLDGVIATIKGYATAEEFKKAEYAPLVEASTQKVLDQLADYRNVVDQAMLTDDGDFFKNFDPRIKEFFVLHGILTLADFQAKWQELFEYLLKTSDQDGTREMIKGIGNILKQHDGLPAFDLLLEKDPSWNLLMNGKTLKLATEFLGLDNIIVVPQDTNKEKMQLIFHSPQDFLPSSQTIFIDSVNKKIEAQFIAHMSPEENSGLRDFRELINVSPENIQISVTNLPLQIISEEKLLKGIRFTRENGIELLLSENAKELSRAVQIAILDGAPPIQVAMDFKKLVIDHARQVMAKLYGVDERQLIGDLPALLTNFLRLNLSAMEIKPEAIVESWAFGIMLQAIDLALTIKDPKDSTKNMFTRADFAGIDFDKIIRGAVEKDGQTVKSVDTVKLARPAEMVFLIVEKGLKGTLDRQGVSSSEQIKQLSRAMSMMGAAHISALVSHFFYGFKMVNAAVMAISGKIAALRKSKTSFSSDAVRSDGEISSPDQRSGDQAMLTRDGNKEVGGIDLNPEFLDLKIKRDGAGIPLPLPQQSIEQMMQIEGFLPVIINVTPIQSLPMLLGMDVVPDGEDSGNRLSQLDAMDKVAKLD
jgi:hypothetical protein